MNEATFLLKLRYILPFPVGGSTQQRKDDNGQQQEITHIRGRDVAEPYMIKEFLGNLYLKRLFGSCSRLNFKNQFYGRTGHHDLYM